MPAPPRARRARRSAPAGRRRSRRRSRSRRRRRSPTGSRGSCTSRRRRRSCARHSGRPGSGRRGRSPGRAGRRSCPSPRRPTARRRSRSRARALHVWRHVRVAASLTARRTPQLARDFGPLRGQRVRRARTTTRRRGDAGRPARDAELRDRPRRARAYDSPSTSGATVYGTYGRVAEAIRAWPGAVPLRPSRGRHHSRRAPASLVVAGRPTRCGRRRHAYARCRARRARRVVGARMTPWRVRTRGGDRPGRRQASGRIVLLVVEADGREVADVSRQRHRIGALLSTSSQAARTSGRTSRAWRSRRSGRSGPLGAGTGHVLEARALVAGPCRCSRTFSPPARSANFAYRRRKLSLTASVGPLRCLARITSATPC